MFTENGFDGYISKPIDIRELNIQLNRFIRDKQPPEIIESARRQTMDILSGSAKNPFTDANLATTVVRNVEASITVLEDICNEMTTNADIDLYTITVHGLRGALSGIGEVDLSDYAYKLEQAGENKDMAVISSETPAFIDALRLLVVKYKPREKSQPAGISDENTLHLRKKLNEIKETCKNYDINEAETILNDLKHNTWPHTINDLLDGIAENLLCGKLKEVVVLVDNFLNAI
jgi:HPt (histidine-containing phosphotransfer) domain-containing protein